jgi:hypothetical protein
MYVVLVDIAALILIAMGVGLLLKRSGTAPETADEDPRAYIRRIAGTMIAAFGLAIGLMVTLFHLQS